MERHVLVHAPDGQADVVYLVLVTTGAGNLYAQQTEATAAVFRTLEQARRFVNTLILPAIKTFLHAGRFSPSLKKYFDNSINYAFDMEAIDRDFDLLAEQAARRGPPLAGGNGYAFNWVIRRVNIARPGESSDVARLGPEPTPSFYSYPGVFEDKQPTPHLKYIS